MSLSLYLGIGLLDSPWTDLCGKPVLSFPSVSAELLSKGVWENKRQFTAHKRSIENAVWCRSSWVHTPNLLAYSDESWAESSRWARSLAQYCYLWSRSWAIAVEIHAELAHCFVDLYWTGASSTSYSAAREFTCDCSLGVWGEGRGERLGTKSMTYVWHYMWGQDCKCNYQAARYT